MSCTSIDFADLARSISAAARALKLVVPSFRTPPTHPTALTEADRIYSFPGAPS